MNDNRRIRVFVSSTYRDIMGERDELMTQRRAGTAPILP